MMKNILSLFRKKASAGWIDLTGAFTKGKEQEGNDMVFFEQ